MLRRHETIDGTTFETNSTYNPQGLLDTLRYPRPLGVPERTTVSYEYNESNAVERIWWNRKRARGPRRTSSN